MIPMNLLHKDQQAAFLISGIWSSLAYQEACHLKNAYVLDSTEANGFLSAPKTTHLKLHENTAYVYYTPNETINGVRFSGCPDVGNTPLIADMTSCFLTEPFNVSDYGLIFAGAQKNIAPAGLTLVIIRADLLERVIEKPPIPTMLNYNTHVLHKSLYATPPTFNCYMALKMLRWIKDQGGVDTLYKVNRQKSAALYQYIDDSSFYYAKVEKKSRSIVNVCFSLSRPELEADFLLKASQSGLVALQGHRLVGGLRASLYNAMPMDGVHALIAFMQDFSNEHAL
jgi:phosphoserine aminotransferase